LSITILSIQLFQLRLSTSKAEKSNTSGKVEYERERLLGIVNKLMNFQSGSQQPFALVFEFSALLVDNLLIEIAVYPWKCTQFHFAVRSTFLININITRDHMYNSKGIFQVPLDVKSKRLFQCFCIVCYPPSPQATGS
jgi:hypothetical protein